MKDLKGMTRGGNVDFKLHQWLHIATLKFSISSMYVSVHVCWTTSQGTLQYVHVHIPSCIFHRNLNIGIVWIGVTHQHNLLIFTVLYLVPRIDLYFSEVFYCCCCMLRYLYA